MECDDVRCATDGQRAPPGETVVRVDHVEPLTAMSLANLARGPEPSPGAVGFDHEHLDLHAVHRAQRLDLVANEHTELRSRGRGVHARHDQHPHRARSVLVNAVFHDAVAQSLHARLEP